MNAKWWGQNDDRTMSNSNGTSGIDCKTLLADRSESERSGDRRAVPAFLTAFSASLNCHPYHGCSGQLSCGERCR